MGEISHPSVIQKFFKVSPTQHQYKTYLKALIKRQCTGEGQWEIQASGYEMNKSGG